MPSIIANAWGIKSEYLGLMLDYDGTLTPIVEDPTQAFISSEHIEQLRLLSRQSNIRLAIISGRSIQQLRCFLNELCQENILFCGLHGGEIYQPQSGIFLLSPAENENKLLLKQFKHNLQEKLQQENLFEKGVIFEDKTHSIALHYRMAEAPVKSRATRLFEEQFKALLGLSEYFKIQPGKEVLEVLPKAFDKGQCVQLLYHHWQQGRHTIKPCYVGDDLTDEAAFRMVNQLDGLSICIGKALDATEATQTLPSIEVLYAELARLCLKS